MSTDYEDYLIRRYDEGGKAGCFILSLFMIGHVLNWLKKALLSIDIDWKMFVPDGIINFFSLPFHFWCFWAITALFTLSIISLFVKELGRNISTLFVPIIFFIPIMFLWTIVGAMYGFKSYFSEYGFFSSVSIGIRTAWNSSVGFFSSSHIDISWINLSIGFVVLLLLLSFTVIAACQLLYFTLNLLGVPILIEKIGIKDGKETVISLLAFILILWLILSVGGIVWLIIT